VLLRFFQFLQAVYIYQVNITVSVIKMPYLSGEITVSVIKIRMMTQSKITKENLNIRKKIPTLSVHKQLFFLNLD